MPNPTSAPAKTMIENLEGRRLLSGIVYLSNENTIFQTSTGDTGTIIKETRVKGLVVGDQVVGIDYRPASGELYGLVDTLTGADRIVKINPVNGKTSTTFELTTALIRGVKYGVDFNPVADAMRIVNTSGQNLRVPFSSGTTIVDTTLSYNTKDLNGGLTPHVVAAAYTNSYAGTTATVLYNIDSTLNNMVFQDNPNAGVIATRGPLGADTGDEVGFDIEPSRSLSALTNVAYATLTRVSDTVSRLYTIDLDNGGVTDIGIVGGLNDGRVVRAIAVVPTGGTTSTQRKAAAKLALAASKSTTTIRDSVNKRDSVIA